MDSRLASTSALRPPDSRRATVEPLPGLGHWRDLNISRRGTILAAMARIKGSPRGVSRSSTKTPNILLALEHNICWRSAEDMEWILQRFALPRVYQHCVWKAARARHLLQFRVLPAYCVLPGWTQLCLQMTLAPSVQESLLRTIARQSWQDLPLEQCSQCTSFCPLFCSDCVPWCQAKRCG